MPRKKPSDNEKIPLVPETTMQTIAGVELKLTATNQLFCLFEGKVSFPFLRGPHVFFDGMPEGTIPQEAVDCVKRVLTRQWKIRQSQAYRDDLEAEQEFHFND